MLINEIFYSLQGEGVHMGKASIFIRLSRCNLRCSFCDTEFDTGTEMTLEELRDAIAPYPGRRIIWTGGEPTLQLTAETVAYFKALGYHQSIETNGTRRPPEGQRAASSLQPSCCPSGLPRATLYLSPHPMGACQTPSAHRQPSFRERATHHLIHSSSLSLG